MVNSTNLSVWLYSKLLKSIILIDHHIPVKFRCVVGVFTTGTFCTRRKDSRDDRTFCGGGVGGVTQKYFLKTTDISLMDM